MGTTQSFIHLNDIHLSLESEAGVVDILKGISLNVEEGETVSIIGPSGAGKTSLMMLLGGLESSTKGEIHIAEENLSQMDEDALTQFRQSNIGIVFQNFHLIPTMSALENVAVPLEFMGDKDAFAKAEKALDIVGLKDRLQHYPSQLSGGEQQRVAVARAFVTEPRLILADEPTGNLDGETGQMVMDILFDLTRNKKLTLLMVTHDNGLAGRCDRTINIVDGVLQG